MPNLAAVVDENARTYPTNPAMRYKAGDSWISISYAELHDRVARLSRALVAAGVQAGDKVGIFSENRPEWSIADYAALRVGAVTVPIYATNTADQAAYVAQHADLVLLFVGEQDQCDKITEVRSQLPKLSHVVVFDDEATTAEPGFEHLSDFLARDNDAGLEEQVQQRLSATEPTDTATLIYTSGTTGEPKGAVLTQANIANQIEALEELFPIGPGDRSLCFLPLSHAYERGWSFYVLASGAENSYVYDPKRVAEAMVEVHPNAMVSVPRLYEKIYAKIVDTVEQGSPMKARIFHWAIKVGGKYQHRLYAGKSISPVLRAEHALADRLVLSTIRDAVGGEKKVFSAGGAPLSPEIEEFFFAAGLFICQGYGLTETTAMLTCNHPKAFKFGTVGKAVPGTQLRIAEHGEIQARGSAVMVGYYGQPTATEAAFDDGWFKTGDVGSIDNDGFLSVTDRIKDLIVTSQGKNIAPQHVEGVLGVDPFIEQIVVLGDRRKYLTALIEPAFELVERYAKEHDISYLDHHDLMAKPEIHDMYEERIQRLSEPLAGYEQVKRFTLLDQGFTQELGQMTPTLKLRRKRIEQDFCTQIDAMYEA